MEKVNDKSEKVLKSKQVKQSSVPPKKVEKKPIKKPANAYFHFCQATRPTVLKSQPNMPFGKVSSELSRLWKVATEADKARFEKMATDAKRKYEEERGDDEDQGNLVESMEGGRVLRSTRTRAGTK